LLEDSLQDRSAPMMNPVTVVLVEDHALVRQAFRHVLEGHPRIKVVGEGSTGLEAVELARAHHPDVILLDMVMPEMNGIEAAYQIRQMDPRIRLMVVSMYSDELYVRQALRVGMKGYVLKDALDLDLSQAVLTVAQGQTYLSPRVAAVLYDVIREGREATNDDPYQLLTQRERQILQMVAEGRSSKEIAQSLGTSPKTIAVHRSNLMQKLDIHSAAELALYAVKRGLVKPE
jgi:two-component system, NarL family, response regulator NreC